MGTADKTIRILIAIVIGILYFTNVISGTLVIVLSSFALIFILTSFIGFCPLYAPSVSIRQKRKEDEKLFKRLERNAYITVGIGCLHHH